MPKVCTKCGVEKDDKDFHRRGKTGRLRSSCKACTNKENLDRYFNNPSTKEAHRKASRKHGLKKYGLTEDDYLEMHEKQSGSCAICFKEIATIHEDRYLSACVDHCHDTKVVRGLLCWDCNVGLGKFHDSVELLSNAISYLQLSREGEEIGSYLGFRIGRLFRDCLKDSLPSHQRL